MICIYSLLFTFAVTSTLLGSIPKSNQFICIDYRIDTLWHWEFQKDTQMAAPTSVWMRHKYNYLED